MLAKEKLNERQIRNIITLARQLTDEGGVGMRYSHLEEVIEISSSFNKEFNRLKSQEMRN